MYTFQKAAHCASIAARSAASWAVLSRENNLLIEGPAPGSTSAFVVKRTGVGHQFVVDTVNTRVGIGGDPSEVLHVKAGNVQGIRIESSSNSPILDFYSLGTSTRNFSLRSNYTTSGNFEILRSSTTGGAPTVPMATFD